MNSPTFTLLEGDVLARLADLPDESVHCVVTSPPYWGLRDYGADGQLGLEPTPEQYVDRMVAVFREVRRVLRDDGTLWLNIGDSYAGSWGAQGRSPKPQQQVVIHHEECDMDEDCACDAFQGVATGFGYGLSESQIAAAPKRASHTGSWVNDHPTLKPKDLVGIPWRLAFALQADGWYLRSEIIWAKPNPMPESVTDRPTKAHEQVFLLTKSARYFYDADAVREPYNYDGRKATAIAPHEAAAHENYKGRHGRERWPGIGKAQAQARKAVTEGGHDESEPMDVNPVGRNLRTVWTIPTEPYPEAHFATYPTRLVEPCVKAGTSEHGCCPECGSPWRRMTERVSVRALAEQAGSRVQKGAKYAGREEQGLHSRSSGLSVSNSHNARTPQSPQITTTGWQPGCDHGRPPVPCTVLDPFTGSGTTAFVALSLGRSAIGIELNPEYASLARKRVNRWDGKRMRMAQTTLEVAP